MKIELPSIFKEPCLIAGTRVTGEEPHLGTFYGWIRPIIRASGSMNVCILIADYQSLDVMLGDKTVTEAAEQLEKNLRLFLPNNISIVRESHIVSMPLLAILTSILFSGSHLKRIGPLRKLKRLNQSITLNTLLYPSMMVANIYALGGTHMLGKPEGKFQHRDILNDILKRGSTRFGWPQLHLKAWKKDKINIPSLDGTGPMKREREKAGYISVVAQSEAKLYSLLALASTPGYLSKERFQNCRVISKIWKSIGENRIFDAQTLCSTNRISCNDCVKNLASCIFNDLRKKVRIHNERHKDSRVIYELAEQRIHLLIDQAIDSDKRKRA